MSLKGLEILQENTCVGVFFNKVAGPQNSNFIKERFQHRIFPAKFAKFLRTPCLTDESPGAASAGLRFPACNFVKKAAPAKMFFLGVLQDF